MNIVITLPAHLSKAIMEGRKKCEMRRCCPKLFNLGHDGFFVVEKGTKNVVCWCKVKRFVEINTSSMDVGVMADSLCVNEDFIRQYIGGRKKVFLWEIEKCFTFRTPLHLWKDLAVNKAPQSFCYAPLSHGVSY